MIDPAVIDLMHHMSKALPALQRQASESAWGGPDAATSEAYVREIEREISAWIAETERRVTSLAKNAPAHPVPNTIHRLDQMIEAFEAAVPNEIAFFKRATKRSLVAVKRTEATAPASALMVSEQRRRILASLSAYGLARQDVLFALRALRSDLDGSARSGPVFDNPHDLGAHLRAAVA